MKRIIKNEKGLNGILITVLILVIAIIVAYKVFNPNGDHTDESVTGVVPQIERIADDAIDQIQLPLDAQS